MLDYKSWKMLNENLGSATLIGFGTGPATVGVIGSNFGNVAPTVEAGKNPEPPEMDDADMDMDSDDSDEDGDEDEKELPKKKHKCSCEDHDDEDEGGEEEQKESTYFGNGLDSFFCSCQGADPKDGLCVKCNKYVVSESFSPNMLVDECLRFYRGDQSALYQVASYVSKNYVPSKTLKEDAMSEVEDMLKQSKEDADEDSFRDLMQLGYHLYQFGQ